MWSRRDLTKALVGTGVMVVLLSVAGGALVERGHARARTCVVARKYARTASDSADAELRCGPFLPEGVNPLLLPEDSLRVRRSLLLSKAEKARKCAILRKYARTARDSADVELSCGNFPDMSLTGATGRIGR